MYGEKMGIRSRVKKALQKIRVLGQIIHEESKYPGRPQPHVVAKNPLWGGGDAREDKSEDVISKEEREKEETGAAPIPVEKDTSTSQQNEGTEKNDQGSLNEEGADYWFLQYDDVEGWNESNPGQKKSDEK